MMRIAGLDFSTKAPGISIFDTDTNKLSAYTINTKPFKKDYKRRNRYLIHTIFNALKTCNKVYIEDYAFSAKGRITDIAEPLGAIKYQLPISCKIYLVSPGTLKKEIAGKGNATKKQVMDAVNKKLNSKITDDNLADACGLMLMGIMNKGKIREWDPAN